jgi:hypothetical protein
MGQQNEGGYVNYNLEDNDEVTPNSHSLHGDINITG